MKWIPPGQIMGDFWCAPDGEPTQVFYLQAERTEANREQEVRKNYWTVGSAKLEANGWKVVSDKPVFRSRTSSTAWDNYSIWTGAILKENGRYYMFYTGRSRQDEEIWTPLEWQRPQKVGLATSKDMLNWRRHTNSMSAPIIPNPGANGVFDGVAWRDPYPIKLGDQYHVFISARVLPGNHDIAGWDEGGAIACVTSKSLTDWSSAQTTLFACSRHFYQMEVPQVFWVRRGQKKVAYLIFCTHERDNSRLRRRELPATEIREGTFYMRSKPVPVDSTELPPLWGRARFLSSLYAGRIFKGEDGVLTFYGCHKGGIAEDYEFSLSRGYDVKVSPSFELSI